MKVEDRGISSVFLELAAAEELAVNLTSGGWAVEREAQVDDNRVDLVARRGDEAIFYEFKVAGSASPAGWADHLIAQQQLARRHNAAFRLVMVRPPRQMELEIEGVERMLFEWLVQHPPMEVEDIAGHTLIDDVDSVDLTSVRISGTIAEVSGEAILGVTLQTGGGEEIGSESFPFTFSAMLDLATRSAEDVDVHEVDTTSWYGTDDQDFDLDGPPDPKRADKNEF